MIYGKDLNKRIEDLQKQSQTFSDSIKSLQEKIKEFLDPMKKVRDEVTDSIANLANKWEETAINMRKMLSSVYTQPIIKSIQPLFPPEVMQSLKKKRKISTAGKVLNSLGWWIFPDMDLADLEKILKLHEEGKSEMIQKILIKRYNNEVDKILEDWKKNPLLKKRIHILEDVIWAHKKEKYTLSVPAIFPQIEGIIIEASGEKGYVEQRKIPELAKKLLLGNGLNYRHYFLLPSICSLIQVNFEWGGTSAQFGRGPVLHGFFTEYNKKEYSLKLILLLDYIQKFLSFKRNYNNRSTLH